MTANGNSTQQQLQQHTATAAAHSNSSTHSNVCLQQQQKRATTYSNHTLQQHLLAATAAHNIRGTQQQPQQHTTTFAHSNSCIQQQQHMTILLYSNTRKRQQMRSASTADCSCMGCSTVDEFKTSLQQSWQSWSVIYPSQSNKRGSFLPWLQLSCRNTHSITCALKTGVNQLFDCPCMPIRHLHDRKLRQALSWHMQGGVTAWQGIVTHCSKQQVSVVAQVCLAELPKNSTWLL